MCPLATAHHSRRVLSDQGRLFSRWARPGESAGPHFARYAGTEAQTYSTRLHPESQLPSQIAGLPTRSSGRERFFYQVLGIRAGNPMFRSLPIDAQTLERLADGLSTDLDCRPTSLDTYGSDQV